MFTLRQYLTTLADTHGLTKTLGGMEVCRDSRGRMCYTVGNSAIVFRVRHEGHIRSLRCYMHPPRHLAEIYGERLLPQELYLYDSPRSGVWVDVVLGDWIEGATLHEAVAEAAAAEDATRLGNWPRRSTAWPQGLRRTTGHTETSNPKISSWIPRGGCT